MGRRLNRLMIHILCCTLKSINFLDSNINHMILWYLLMPRYTSIIYLGEYTSTSNLRATKKILLSDFWTPTTRTFR